MQTFDTLYKRDSNGNIREWRMELLDSRYRTVAGVQDGSHVTSEWTLAEAKNVGRSNATTTEEQAAAEVQSHYTKKLEVDYHAHEADVDTPKIFQPMLALTDEWKDTKGSVNYDEDVYYQPKLDGVRCIITRHGMWSRKGKPIVSSPHVLEALAPAFAINPDAVFDGELYNHDLKHEFEEIVSMVKKAKCKPADLEITKEMVQIHLYDYPAMMHDVFIDRYNGLVSMITQSGIPTGGKSPIHIVPTMLVKSESEVDYQYGRSLKWGYEGGIVRINVAYQQKRTKFLIKRKNFQDREFEIIRIEEGTGNWKGCAKKIIFKNDIPNPITGAVGEECGAGMKGSKELMREVFENRHEYPGTHGTIKYCGRTKYGKPKIAVCKYLYKGQREL